jgi:hypothetical protein
MAKEKTPLVQTKGTWRAIGIVNRLGNDGAYTEGEFDKGKNIGKEWKSLRFSVKTSDTNELFVELFGMEKESVYAYKPATKEAKKKDPKAKGDTKKISFENRDNIPSGYNLIGIKVGKFEDDEADKPKVALEDYVEFDAVDEIFNTFEDGDAISLSGSLSFNEFENQQGVTVKQTRYQIGYASKLAKPVDFNDEKFEETASFDQEIIFVGSMYDKDTKKLTVIGRTVSYDGSWFDFPFVIDTANAKLNQVATAFHKKLKFGDFVKVMGLCLNKVEQVEAEEQETPKDSIFGDGGFAPKGQEKRANTRRTTEMQITGVDLKSFVQKRYKEEDFVVEEDLVDDEDIDSDNPFASDEDEDDDLPFN